MSEHAVNLIKQESGPLAAPEPVGRPLYVGDLEQALLAQFPKDTAEEWDRTGLLVGDPMAEITGVAVALDPTVEAVRKTVERGANVLLTHHPAFLDAPTAFHPFESDSLSEGAVVYEAIRLGVALVNFHTALDVSSAASRVLPGLLGLEYVHPLEMTTNVLGYGQVCKAHGITVKELVARCVSVFGRMPRVWGDPSSVLETVATWTGSTGGAERLAFEQHVDCMVCGEIKYHAALSVSKAGMVVVELGHDVSELPLSATLAAAAQMAGISPQTLYILDQSTNWNTPESVRL